MIGIFRSLTGKVGALYSGLTSGTRMANLDNLDATISSRAAASTALSTATWSNTLATNLGRHIGAPIASGITPHNFGDLIYAWNSVNGGSGYSTNFGAVLGASLGTTTSNTSSASYVTSYSYSGSGYLDMAYAKHTSYQAGTSGSGSLASFTLGFEIVLDGVVVYSTGDVTIAGSYNPWGTPADFNTYRYDFAWLSAQYVEMSSPYVTMAAMPKNSVLFFNSSVEIRHKVNRTAAGSGSNSYSMESRCSIVKTS